MTERHPNIAGVVRSVPPSQTLTPPVEEQEQRESGPNKRASWVPLGGILGSKNMSKDNISSKANNHSEQSMNRNGNGVPGDRTGVKDNAVVKTTSSAGNRVNEGRAGGRY